MFRLAIVQMPVCKDKMININKAVELIKVASDNGANIVVLPEIFNSPYGNKYFVENAEKFPGVTSNTMMEIAKECGIYLVAGSIPESFEGNIYNTCFVYNPKGEMIAGHRKVHLFDIHIEGKQHFMESDTLTAGDDFTVFDTEYARIGIGICFDVRFPEYFRILAKEGAELVLLPAAFNMTTGPAHWELSLRMRAVDNQYYMAAASPARNNELSYVSYAHSMIVDPWGEVLIDAGVDENIIYSDIDLEKVKKVRQSLPLLKNIREDIYETIKK